jgi:hypothetical protein
LHAVRGKKKRNARESYSEKTLLKFVKEHLSKEYPNPRREGCPSQAIVKRMAHDPQQVDASIVYHVFHCSPCYKTCSGLLARLKTSR